MSCFETSTFTKNPDVMNQDVLMQACNKLNWEYTVNGNELTIFKLNEGEILGGEYAIKVTGNTVKYNTYYLENAEAKVRLLRETFSELFIEYAKESIISEFKKAGYNYKRNSKFTSSEEEKVSFFMVGRSKMKGETEPVASIKFTILKDGSIKTDSDYIPEDIHVLADKAMDNLEHLMGDKRTISGKEIPLKYKTKAFCQTKNIQKLKKKK